MDKHSLDVLELKKIVKKIEGYAATNIGKEIISELNPVSDSNYVKEKLAEVTAARELMEDYGSAPFGGIRDLREIIKKINKEMVLTTGEIVDVRDSLSGFNNLQNYFEEINEKADPVIIERRYSLITNMGNNIIPLNSLAREIDRCIDEYGEIKDNASSKLRSLRAKMNSIENKIRDRLEDIIRSKKYQSMLQDSLITRRENRYVVPVKKEYRNTFSGIVHDQSASGMTIFIEPMVIVKLNNRLREIKAEEEIEIHRILQELSNSVRENIDDIKTNLKLAAIMDVIFAKAEYSIEIGGVAPEINEKGIIIIKQGRHPLLQNEPVPIDIEVGKDFLNLVITGPNTGGKTVALKTVGLFVLMAETGIHIPVARGTNISIFENVFADIGDEQSIEQNLSTFSSHMNKIKRYVKKADQDSLVLLDELGAGTDPREGAALGIAILEKLKSKQVVTVATTHYSQLKSYAYSYSGVENASVEFDIETLQPTYRLIMGVPGGSNAFQIALKLGISEEIINDAEKLMDGEELKVENIISDLNRDRRKYQELKRDMENKKREVTEARDKHRKLLESLQEREKEILTEAREKARKIINETRHKSKRIVRNLKDAEYTTRPAVDRKATQINEEIKEIEDDLFDVVKADEPQKKEEIELGDRVRVKSVGQKGEVIDINPEKDEATVQAGILKVTADIEDLIKVDIPDSRQDDLVNSYKVTKSEKVSSRVDLRGERYEEAQRKLDKYLDDAFLAGFKNVEIIHGKGTGALRNAVAEVLDNNPHVPSFRLGRQEEGGGGVTIATLRH